MTETSYLWDGIVTGDATLAPYDKDEFNRYVAGMHTADSDDAVVIPGYLNDLDVLWTGGLSVSVDTGAALIQNYMYVNDSAVSLAVSTIESGYFRYDYVVLELDTLNQKVRLKIVEGTAVNVHTDLEYPGLTQTDAIWQSPLASIYVYNASVVYYYDIHDERTFAYTAYTRSKYDRENLLKNSEFMILNSDGSVPCWTGTTVTADTRAYDMKRGQTVYFNGAHLYQYVNTQAPIKQGEMYYLKGTINDVTGDSATQIVVAGLTTLTGTGVENITYRWYRRIEAGTEVEVLIPLKIDTTSRIYGFRIDFYPSTGDVAFGQFVLVKGYHPGPYRLISETILLDDVITDAAWSDTAKSTSTTTIDFTADFSGLVMPGTKAVILRMRARDSGSAGGAPYLRAIGYNASYTNEYGRVELQGVTNDVYREVQCIVPVNQAIYDAQDNTPQLRLDVVATGAGTLDATVEVVGVII